MNVLAVTLPFFALVGLGYAAARLRLLPLDSIAGLNVFVFPTVAETFGLAAVEAAQAGIPVVANDIPVLREVLTVDGEPCALFADASDVEDFAAKIDIVFRDHARAARIPSSYETRGLQPSSRSALAMENRNRDPRFFTA